MAYNLQSGRAYTEAEDRVRKLAETGGDGLRRVPSASINTRPALGRTNDGRAPDSSARRPQEEIAEVLSPGVVLLEARERSASPTSSPGVAGLRRRLRARPPVGRAQAASGSAGLRWDGAGGGATRAVLGLPVTIGAVTEDGGSAERRLLFDLRRDPRERRRSAGAGRGDPGGPRRRPAPDLADAVRLGDLAGRGARPAGADQRHGLQHRDPQGQHRLGPGHRARPARSGCCATSTC